MSEDGHEFKSEEERLAAETFVAPEVSSKPEAEQEPEFTPERAAKLLFRSFQFSQGSAQAQADIFHWLHLRYPDYKITPDIEGHFKEQSSKMIKGFFSAGKRVNHQPMEDEAIEGILSVQLELMKQTFDEQLPSETEEEKAVEEQVVLSDYFHNIIFMEGKYIGKGRERGTPEAPERVKQSQLVDYALLKKPTGLAEYDQFFSSLRSYLTGVLRGEIGTRDGSRDVLLEVISTHNQQPNQSKVDLTKLLEEGVDG